MLGPLEHATLFIKTLHVFGGLIEITALAPKRRPIKRYFTDPAIAAEWALETNWQGYSVFSSVNPRWAFDGHESTVAATVALPLDFDAGKHDPGAALELLTAHGIPPSIVARSGRGTHAYLLLAAPSAPDAAKLTAERLCKVTSSDRVFNCNRIMRIPGSVNWKDPPTWAYLTGMWDRRYSLADVDAALDRMGAPTVRTPRLAPPRQPQAPPQDIHELMTRIPGHAAVLISAGERNPYSGQTTRSETDFYVVCALVRGDATDEQIRWIYENCPIGSLKYAAAGAHYLNRTIEKARLMTAEPIRNGSRSSDARALRRAQSHGGARDGV
jgi:hypothetical protein